MPLFEQLHDKYAAEDVALIHVYVREPHPEERGFKAYAQHTSYEQKLGYAKELVDLKGINLPVVVDEMDEAVNQMLGGLPNTVWVVGKNGRVHYKSSWADADKVDQALAELVSADHPERSVPPTFSTQDVSDEI